MTPKTLTDLPLTWLNGFDKETHPSIKLTSFVLFSLLWFIGGPSSIFFLSFFLLFLLLSFFYSFFYLSSIFLLSSFLYLSFFHPLSFILFLFLISFLSSIVYRSFAFLSTIVTTDFPVFLLHFQIINFISNTLSLPSHTPSAVLLTGRTIALGLS